MIVFYSDFLKCLKWRQQIGVDYLLANYQVPDIVLNYVPSTFLGFDKEGSSVRLLPQGTVDYKGLLLSIRKLDLTKCLILTYEYDIRQMKMNNKKTGKNADTFVFILDYSGFSLRQVASKSVMNIVFYLVHVFEANYPERLKKAFLINIPPLFSTVFSAVKPFLAEETREKFLFFGKDGWQEELLKNIDAEVLPAYLGGKRTDNDGDPECASIIFCS
ncbi:retinal-binding protein-like isoform X2 [Uloborus diversus]|uniref:retinal-binding protein-like isoform X2 n=1 Tax=Uloborus diversus TaxID=327109 RepID=UPI002409AB0B|nr:retinal-binding protein-like isoform X2 [Uloborus diversus]